MVSSQHIRSDGELRCVSDIPTEKCEGSRSLRSDGVGLRMTETEKYKLGLSVQVLYANELSLVPSDMFRLGHVTIQRHTDSFSADNYSLPYLFPKKCTLHTSDRYISSAAD